jgi:hypothetical protein
MSPLHPRVIRASLAAIISFAALITIAPRATAQCPTPSVSVDSTGLDFPIDRIRALVNWDPDGPGPQPDVLAAAGTLEVSRSGISVVSRYFIGAFDGASWRQIALDPIIYAMTVFNGELVVAGPFSTISGVPAFGIASWNGSRWLPLGNPGATIMSLTVFNGELYAGTGSFTTQISTRVLRWDGAAWQPVGDTFGGTSSASTAWPPGIKGIRVLTTFNGELIAGGNFTTIGASQIGLIARWNGAAWAPMGQLSGTPAASALYALTVHQGRLFAGGEFSNVAGLPEMTRVWNGSDWTTISLNQIYDIQPTPKAFSLISDGQHLLALGDFTCTGQYAPVTNIAQWDGSLWAAIDYPRLSTQSIPGPLTIFRGNLYLGGSVALSTDPYPGLVRWSRWLADPPISQSVHAGATLRLTVRAAGDLLPGGPPSFTWRHGVNTIIDGPGGATPGGGTVSGANSDTLTITGVAPTDFGAYRVQSQNECGTMDAAPAFIITVLPPCTADFNNSGAATVQDVFDYLAAWFAQCAAPGDPPCTRTADIDGSGDITLQDLFDFLSDWFAGC